jgi:hypothetical protein
MLKNQIKNLISSMEKPELFKEEKEYAEKHLLLPDHVSILDKNPVSRFVDAYIERSDKESEEVIQVEDESFLKQPVGYLKKQMNEFIYVESNWFELIGVDAVSLEVDDVFGTYDVMLGLKLQKKWESVLKAELNESLQDEAKFDLMFSSDDGLWNLNFDLDSVVGFKEDMTIGEAFQLIYQFLFKLVAAVEEHK